METLPSLQSALAEPNQELDLRRAWQTIARSAWIIVVCIGLALAAAVVAARRIEPMYQAAATVKLDDKARNANSMAQMYFGPDNTSSLAMASEIITSRKLAAEVVDSLGLRVGVARPPVSVRSRYIQNAKTDSDAPSETYVIVKVDGGREVRLQPQDSLLGVYPDSGRLKLIRGSVTLTAGGKALDHLTLSVAPRIETAEALRGQISVTPANKDANVLSISYSGKDSILVRDIPNMVAHAFVRERMSLNTSGASNSVDFLQRQLATLNADVGDAEAKIRQYLEKEGIASVIQVQATLAQEMQTLQTLKRELESQRESLMRALEPLRNPDTLVARDQFLKQVMSTPEFKSNGVAGGEVERYDALIHERAVLLQRYTSSTSDIKNLDKRIHESQDLIRDRTVTFVTNIDRQLAALAPRIAKNDAAMKRVPEQLIEYSKLERIRTIDEAMITLVQGRLKESEIQAAVQDSTASVLDDAVQPNQQGGNSTTLIFAVAIFSGLVVGMAVAFLRDWLDTTIRTEHDLATIVGVAVVGIIPNLQQQARSVGYRLPPPKDGDESRPAAGREYQTPAAEAYRTLRTNLNYLTPPNPPHVIVITSALPGDGKTTTVVNLAVTLAHQGQRVILIDAETRRGTVHDVFGIPPAPGFFDLMYGQASPGECIRRVQMEGGGTLDVLPLGSAPSVNPADLLVAGRLQPLFERLRAQYDYVLIDTPPLNLFTDGALIGAHADALLLVARADKTDREELKFAVQQLRNVNVTLAGTILNDVEFRRSSRYRLGYGYYYDYAR